VFTKKTDKTVRLSRIILYVSYKGADFMMHRVWISLATLMITVTHVSAAVPDIQTPSPVIHLADNLDEADNLGWCIDTQGRGFGELLHAHSCKPRGGDVQFGFEVETGLIRSIAFPTFCMAHMPSGTATFALVNCDATAMVQQFGYRDKTGEIILAQDPSKCVVVGQQSRSAGPFMSRALDLLACAGTPETLKRWVVKP
jgi:hypothetical protein